jgi:microcin C transport system substrate-binding protein
MSHSVTRLLAALLIIVSLACGGSSTPSEEEAGTHSSSATSADNRSVSTNKDDYPVFPDADSGADPSVSAEQGGKGFTGKGWETNTSFDLIGDPRAVKGGTLRQANQTDFPSTLRYVGPNVTAWNLMLHTMVYETLLTLHPTTLDFIPALATHWQVSGDKRSFRFRLDPNARFSDGMPVTSADVVASWKLLVDKTLQDPARMLIFSNFETPVAESNYIVSVRAKDVKWLNFLYFAQLLYIYPEHVLEGLTGEQYVKEYNYKMLPGTGPYAVAEADVDKGNAVTIRRRKDYWGERQRRNVGLANFDEVRQIVVRDRNLEFERFKRGDIDYYYVQRAQMWVEELGFDQITRGLMQKRKIFNNSPQGVQGLAMNTRREPYDDVRVRKALGHLFNREAMVKNLMFGEYTLMDSIFPSSVYENPGNEKVRYDPKVAVSLLAEAGWKDRDASGRLMKGGRPLAIEVIYSSQASERFLTIYQEDLRKVGITLNLRLVTFETLVKLLDERTFGMVSIAYTGELFPLPEANYKSELADQKNTNNITGFKNARADRVIEEYNKEFDLARRIPLLKEFDALITGEHHWILEWTAPYERVVFWHKFGYPEGYLTRIGDYRDIPLLWWNDPARGRALDEARKSPTGTLAVGPSDSRYWLDFGERERAAAPAPR